MFLVFCCKEFPPRPVDPEINRQDPPPEISPETFFTTKFQEQLSQNNLSPFLRVNADSLKLQLSTHPNSEIYITRENLGRLLENWYLTIYHFAQNNFWEVANQAFINSQIYLSKANKERLLVVHEDFFYICRCCSRESDGVLCDHTTAQRFLQAIWEVIENKNAFPQVAEKIEKAGFNPQTFLKS